jgi:hypothetical protein
VVQLGPAVKATTELGYAPVAVLPIGIVELVCLVLYLVLGADSREHVWPIVLSRDGSRLTP